MCDFTSLRIKNKNAPLVKAPIDKYELYWNDDLQISEGENVAGNIVNIEDENLRIMIIVNDGLLREYNHPRMAFTFDRGNPYIFITTKFFHDVNDNWFLTALIWHEVGHFHTLQFIPESVHESSHYAFTESREISNEERAADLFSIYFSGKAKYIKAINWLIHERKMQTGFDPNKQLAIDELLIRKRFAKNIDAATVLSQLFDVCS